MYPAPRVSRRAHTASLPRDQSLTSLPAHSYYNAVIIVDIFQFSNSYAVLPDIADVAQYGEEDDEGVTDLRTECENYVFNGSRKSSCQVRTLTG